MKKHFDDGHQFLAHILNKLAKLRDPQKYSVDDMHVIYCELEQCPEISEFIQHVFQNAEDSNSSMAKFWLSFMKMTEVLMMNIHALRTQNWDEFKVSLRLMMPWLQIYDNDKYGRCMNCGQRKILKKVRCVPVNWLKVFLGLNY